MAENLQMSVRNENMEYADMELTLNDKERLHERLMKILKTKLETDPDNPFLNESLAAEEKEWAKLTAKKKDKK